MDKAKKMARGDKFHSVGYYKCLDFVNTEFTKEGGRCIDSLRGFVDLIDWLCESRLFNRAQLERALKSVGKRACCGANFSICACLAQGALRYGRKARDTPAGATGIT